MFKKKIKRIKYVILIIMMVVGGWCFGIWGGKGEKNMVKS